MSFTFQGNMIRGVVDDGKWMFIQWLYPGRKKFTAVKEVKRAEALIREKGFHGWYVASERDHMTMHKILEKMSATKFREDAQNFYFMKEVI